VTALVQRGYLSPALETPLVCACSIAEIVKTNSSTGGIEVCRWKSGLGLTQPPPSTPIAALLDDLVLVVLLNLLTTLCNFAMAKTTMLARAASVSRIHCLLSYHGWLDPEQDHVLFRCSGSSLAGSHPTVSSLSVCNGVGAHLQGIFLSNRTE
jgi:hypothetical protein